MVINSPQSVSFPKRIFVVMSRRRGAPARKKRKVSARSSRASGSTAAGVLEGATGSTSAADGKVGGRKTRKSGRTRLGSARKVKRGAVSATSRSSSSKWIDTSVRFSKRDLVWVQSDISGACVAKIRHVPDTAGGVYRVNYYGTRSYDLVHDDRLQLFNVDTVSTILDQKCDGDPEAYRSVYYALESLHRRKLLRVSDLPSRTWSVLNRYLNEEESSSSDSDEQTSSSEEEGSSENDNKLHQSKAGTASCPRSTRYGRRQRRASVAAEHRHGDGISPASERSSSIGSSDDSDDNGDSDSETASPHSHFGCRRRFRRFSSCLVDGSIVQKALTSFSTKGRTPRSGSEERLRSLRPRYASPRPGTTARALYGVNDPEVLSALLEFDTKDTQSWLSGAFIDYIFGIFAKVYHDVTFLPTLFAAHELRRMDARDISSLQVSDVLGIPVNLRQVKQIVLCNNLNDNHWTMIRISITHQRRELSLFEPMGLPQTRKSKTNAAAARRARVASAGGAGGRRRGVRGQCIAPSGSAVSARNFPRRFLQWLESVWPTPDGEMTWGELAHSAIKKRHQLTGFDCGVACLLYAEKCGMGMDRQHIARSTSQRHITAYRQVLSDLMSTVMKQRSMR